MAIMHWWFCETFCNTACHAYVTCYRKYGGNRYLVHVTECFVYSVIEILFYQHVRSVQDFFVIKSSEKQGLVINEAAFNDIRGAATLTKS